MVDVNGELAAVFEDVGNALQYQGEAWVKVKSYLEVARVLRKLDEPIDVIAAEGRLEQVPGVGKAIAKKIGEYLERETFDLLDRLDAQVPAGARAMLRDGLAPSVVHHVEKKGYDTPEKLDAAIEHGELRPEDLPKKLRTRFEAYLELRRVRADKS
jgi:DNA polymerase (family 10)